VDNADELVNQAVVGEERDSLVMPAHGTGTLRGQPAWVYWAERYLSTSSSRIR
jgi:hypothetical protein